MRYSSGTAPTSYNYTGQRLDGDTGLLYYGARYYDPALMRFVQADTLVPEPGNPQSLNRYAYVLNNPLKYTDPTGHIVCGFQGRPCPAPPTFNPISIQTGVPFIDYHVELAVNLTVCGLLPCKAENGAIRPLTQEEYLQAIAVNTATAVQPMTAVAADEALALGKQLSETALEAIQQYGIKPYGEIARPLAEQGAAAHHLMEKRFWRQLGFKTKEEAEQKILAVVIDQQTHGPAGKGMSTFTDMLRERLPYGKDYTLSDIWKAHRDVYEQLGHKDWAQLIWESYFKEYNIPYDIP